MKQISSPIRSVAGIIGRQKEKKEIPFRMSAFCVRTDCDEGVLLYHTLTGEMFLISRDETTETNRDALISSWFLVPEGFDEHAFADDVHKFIRMGKWPGKAVTDYTILTTTDCNARCFYCYELGISRIPMTKETAREVAGYIIRKSEQKPVKIRWFGGEPLYNRQAIETICDELNQNGISFESTMVSNGYYLDEDTIRQACSEWHLKKIQITLDGTEEIYNRTKAYIDRDNESPFLRVLNNIQTAAEAGIRVSVRLNMDAANAKDLLLLAEQLAERFDGKANISVYPALLQTFTGKIHTYSSQNELLNSFYAIEDKLDSHGLYRDEKLFQTIRTSRCMADSNISEVILPDGRTGRCEHFSEDMVTGSIRCEQRNADVIREWNEPLTVPECETCALYPLCTRLKKCQWNADGCPETGRIISLRILKKQMIKAYQTKAKEKTNETEE